MWTGLKRSSPFGVRSSGNRVWCRFIARPAEYLLITPSDGNTASVKRPTVFFLVNKNGNRLDKGEIHRTFYALSRQIGLRAVDASHGPRLHDFRHRFAVQTLLRWYRAGDDPERRLPVLSTYLGHAHVTDTYWYLTGTPELLGAATKRLDKRWEAVNAGRA